MCEESKNVDSDNGGNNEVNNITFFKTSETLISLLVINILFFIFNNAQLTVILSFANNKYNNDEILTAAIGTVNTILNLIIYPLLFGLAAVIEILGSQSYVADKHYVFGLFLNKARFIGYVIILLTSLIISTWSENIFNIWSLKTNIRELSLKIIFIRFISIFFEFETYLILRYIQIKNKGSNGMLILSLNGFLLIFYSYIFIQKLDLYAYGCGLVYFANNLSIIIFLWIFVYVSCYDSQILFFFNKDTFSHLGSFFNFFFPLALLSLMDMMSSETMSIIANYFDKKLYSAYINAYSIYYLIGTLSTAFNIATNIIISGSIGLGNGENTKKVFRNVLYFSIMVGSLVCFIFYLFDDRIISLIVEPGETSSITKKMVYISILCNFLDIVTYVLNSSMKALGHIYVSLFVYFFSNISNAFMIYFFSFKTNLSIYGIFYGYFINDSILFLVYSLIFYLFVDFDKAALNVKKNIEKFD